MLVAFENFYLKIVGREGRCQRVFNVLYWTRLSRRRVIWLLPQSLSHPQPSVSSTKGRLADGRRGGEEGEVAKSNYGEKALYSVIQ